MNNEVMEIARVLHERPDIVAFIDAFNEIPKEKQDEAREAILLVLEGCKRINRLAALQ